MAECELERSRGTKPRRGRVRACPVCGKMFYDQPSRDTVYCSRICKGVASRNTHESIIERIDKSGGPDACWPWTGSKDWDGYGMVRLNMKNRRVTHIVWEYENNDTVPDDLLICHICDNPPCCNPAHLFLGNGFDNMQDRRNKRLGLVAEMKCNMCGKELKKESPIVIFEPGKPSQRMCQKCWHDAMGHRKDQRPDG